MHRGQPVLSNAYSRSDGFFFFFGFWNCRKKKKKKKERRNIKDEEDNNTLSTPVGKFTPAEGEIAMLALLQFHRSR